MTKTQKRATGIAAGVLVVAIAVAAFGASPKTGEDSATVDSRLPVGTQSPEKGEIVVLGEYVGTVDPDQQLTVYPKVAGEVLDVKVSVGDTVKAGDVLCEIDSKALRAQINQSQAAIASAEAKAQYSLAIAEKELATHEFNVQKDYDTSLLSAKSGVKQAENGVETAEANLKAARRKLDEHYDLDSGGFVSLQGLTYAQTTDQLNDAITQAEIALEAAQLRLEQAEDSLRSVEMLTKEKAISVNEQVEMARLNTNFSDQYIAIEKLQDDLKNYTITAAIDGIVEQRSVEAFDMASPQAPLFVISNKEAMTVSFSVSEASLEHIKVGDKISVDKNGTVSDGKIIEVSTMVDARSGLFTIKATVDNPEVAKHSGSSVKILAEARKTSKDALLLPIDAIYYDKGEPYVFVEEDGKAVKTFVETGISDAERIEIISGLDGSEMVVTTWNSGLADGAEINVVKANGAEIIGDEASEDVPDSSSGTEEE